MGNIFPRNITVNIQPHQASPPEARGGLPVHMIRVLIPKDPKALSMRNRVLVLAHA